VKKEIKASVRDIVDFVFSEGDILPIMLQKNKLRDGTIIHQEIQRESSGEKEVFVKHKCEVENYLFNIQGRIDILDKYKNYHVTEIKSTNCLENLTENTHLAHFAQAKFYGFMLYANYNLDESQDVDISVIYINRFTYRKKEFKHTFTFKDLERFFYDILKRYLNFQKIIDDFQCVKLSSIAELTFPYNNYRKGQKELIKCVSNVIENRKQLFISAPTGIGKSLGTIYPAVKSLHSKNSKIFYLTAKSMIKDVARDAVNLMREKSGLKIKSLVVTAKDKICLNDCVKCNPKDCPYAKGFFIRINGAVFDIYQNEDDFHFDTLISYSEKHQVCPFEFQLMLSLYSDIIICDYNYVFDIRVYLRRFFDFDTSEFILLIDEAHNMYDRVCNMYTVKIELKQFNEIINLVNEKEIIKQAKIISNKLNQYHNILIDKNKKTMKFLDLDVVIIDGVNSLLSKLEKYFIEENANDRDINEELLSIYFVLNNFIKISDFYSEDFMIWVTSNYDYQITCLNPRDLIKNRTENVLSSCYFSATLHPIDYYLSLLGGDEYSEQLKLDSPFKQDNLQLYINPHISTLYRNRDNTKYQIAYQIESLIKNGGKYIIYFPSYKYLELVYNTFLQINDIDTLIIKQDRKMTESDRVNYLKEFDESDKNIVGFAVLGGVFAEGIDLKGKKLNGVCIIGVGLPMFDDFRNELKIYFEKTYRSGYEYAYMYPGFNKILQAVGRVIRGENDLGIALLIDTRYKYYEYLKLFPKHWSHYQIIDM